MHTIEMSSDKQAIIKCGLNKICIVLVGSMLLIYHANGDSPYQKANPDARHQIFESIAVVNNILEATLNSGYTLLKILPRAVNELN